MKRVYILTKEGKEFNRDGCLHIKAKLEELFGEKDELLYEAGVVLNGPQYIIESANENVGIVDNKPKCYFVISHDKGIAVIGGTRQNLDNFIKDSKEHPTLSSWEVFYEESKLIEA